MNNVEGRLEFTSLALQKVLEFESTELTPSTLKSTRGCIKIYNHRSTLNQGEHSKGEKAKLSERNNFKSISLRVTVGLLYRRQKVKGCLNDKTLER